MHRTLISLAAIFCLFSLALLPGIPAATAASRSPKQETTQPDIDASRLEKKIHDIINRERKDAGLPALGWNRELQRIARDYSRDMATRNFFSHYSPEGQSFSKRYRKAGFSCAVRTDPRTTSLGGENIALSYLYNGFGQREGKRFTDWKTEEQIAAAVVKQWMASAGHRKNILSRDFLQEGIGCHISQDGTVLITENFC
jgi:uncharacterized protein YkwD